MKILPELGSEGGAKRHGRPKAAGQKETFGGYDCKFVKPPTSVFQTECPVCHLVLCDPHQTRCCGTNFCRSCIHRVQDHNKPCPNCRTNYFEVFQDKRLKRSLLQLHVFCTYSKDGCKWSGELAELEHHLNTVVHSGELFQLGDDRGF